MTSIVRVCPLSGGLSPGDNDACTPHCYLLEVDQFTFLLDCGWDASFTGNGGKACLEPFLRELKRLSHKIDAVLLSHPDPLYIGSLPHAVGRLGLTCPIYATVPVYKMGKMFLYDLYQARYSQEEFDHFTLDEVDKTFKMITKVHFNQTIHLKGKGEGLAITAYQAGHMIGASMWKIVKDGEEDIVYAVDFNHKRERHLNGCDLDKISRPSLLITDGYNAKLKQKRRADRDEALMTAILQTLRSGGNVMMAVDTAGRVLELSHMLDQLWQNKESGLMAYSLALLNHVGYSVIESAKSQIEWMSEKLMRSFEGQRNNPFNFKHLKVCHSMSEVNKVPSPKVVLASMPDLECGFSRELFALWATHPKNSVILTSRSPKGTLAHDLVSRGGNDRVINLEIKKRVKLTGAELEEFKRKKDQEQKAASTAADSAMDEDDESSDDEMEAEPQGLAKGKARQVKHDIMAKGVVVGAAGGVGGVGGAPLHPADEPVVPAKQAFFKSTKSKFLMFPFHEDKVKWDDYGEIIKPEDWIDTSMDTDRTGPGGGTSGDNKIEAAAEEDKEANGGAAAASTAAQEVPTKCVSNVMKIQVKAQIQYIDFEGRADGESIYRCIVKMKPRRVVIVRGSREDNKALSDACASIVDASSSDAGNTDNDGSQNKRVFTPRTGEVVDATTETHIYQVRLTDSLLSKLNFQTGKDNSSLAWVDGYISFERAADKADITMDSAGDTDMEEDGGVAVVPTLEPVPEAEIPGHAAIYVNELKLSDFKMVLSKHHISSEFQGGVLFCGSNSQVALRRHDSGRVTIEGSHCDDYYVVRRLLYEQYAIV